MKKDYAAIFEERLRKKYPWLKAMEKYKGMREKISIICTIPWCGHEWKPRPDNLLNKLKYGCPECAKFEQELIWRKETLKWLQAERPDLILRGNLVNYDTPADWKCAKEECGHEWSVDFNSIRGAGSGCEKCGIERSRAARPFQKANSKSGLKKIALY